MRMDAYYYSFESTGRPEIDRILSAVACAGKMFHHTDQWADESDDIETAYAYHKGRCPVDWIQSAAYDAAVERRKPRKRALTLRRLQDEQRPWVKHNFRSDRPAYWPLLGAVEELGELAHAHLKGEQGIRITEDHEANAKDAVADVVIFLADYCSARGWEMQDIVEETWTRVKKRDWRGNPEKGVG